MSPRDPHFASLRPRREQLGLTVEQLATELRISAEHLRALEDGRTRDLPEGPFAFGWLREYRQRLGLDAETGAPPERRATNPIDDEDSPATPTPAPFVRQHSDRPVVVDPPSGPPLWLVRGIAIAAIAALIGSIGYEIFTKWRPAGGEPSATGDAPDQHIELRAQKTTKLRVLIDGDVVFDKQLPNGEKLTFDARDRIELDLPSVESVKIEYNGSSIMPQGRQDEPRKLVFIDDGGP